MFNRLLLLLMSFLMVCTAIEAKVRLAHVVGDDMVVQQQTAVRLWGWSTPGFEVRVSPSWTTKIYTASVAKDGKWEVRVKTPKASYTPLCALAKVTWRCPLGVFMPAQWREAMKSLPRQTA